MEEQLKKLASATDEFVQFCLKNLQGDTNWSRDQALSKAQEAHWWASKGIAEQFQATKEKQ